MTYIANYAPVTSELASAGIVLIPIALLFVLIFTTRVIYAALASLLVFLIIAAECYHMPWSMALIAACNGFLYGAWPICLIVFAAIFTYDMCTITGHFETVKFTIVSLTKDKRLLALLLAYAFSGFIEGASGFSTPIALSAAMMIGVGFTKQEAARAALLGNTIPVVFGGIGIPVITLGTITKIPADLLAVSAVRLLIPFSLAMPWIVVYSVSNLRQTLEVWPACLLTGVVSTGMALLISEVVGPQPVSIFSMIVTLAALGVFVKLWRPRTIIMTEMMAAEEVGMKAHSDATLQAHAGPPTAAAAVVDGVTTSTRATAPPGGVEMVARSASFTARGTTVRDSAPDGRSGVDSAQLARHLSLRIDKAHPLAPELTPRSAELDRERSRSEVRSGLQEAPRAGSQAASEAPALSGAGGHVYVLRRVQMHPDAQRMLDSSHIGTALFPHTVEHAYQLSHRRHGRFMRVTREAGGGSTPMPDVTAGLTPARTGGDVEAGRVDAIAAAAAASVESTASGGSSVPLTRSGSGSGLSASSGAVTAPSHVELTDAAAPPAKAIDGHTSAATDGHGAAGGDHGHSHAKEAAGLQSEVDVHYDALHPPSRGEVAIAWFPWMLISVLVCIWGAPQVKGVVSAAGKSGLSAATFLIPMTGLDLQVIKPDPKDPHDPAHYHLVEAKWTLDLVAATGICLFICAAISSAVFRLHPRKTVWIMWKSFRRMALSFLTICTLLALGYVIKFSGMDTTLGLAAAKTLQGYPFICPWIGFLGVVITGSATSSNVLFGSLQVVAADAIGVNPVQLAAANVAGGVLGHIISTSSMVVAAVATGSDAKSIGPIAKSVVGYALVLITLFSAWNILIVNAFPGFIPSYKIV